MEKFKVTFYPAKKSVEVEKDKTVLTAAISAGVYINSACGGDGVCGRCKVVLKKGNVLAQPTGLLTPEERKKGIHLACLASVQSDLEIDVPIQSTVDFKKSASSETEDIQPQEPVLGPKAFSASALVKKIYLELPVPDFNDKISDLERLCRQIKRKENISLMQTGLANIRELSELLRSSAWKVTVTLGKRNNTSEIVLIEPGDTTARNFGLAFDIGTTTISGQLVDLNTAKALGSKAAYNKQVNFGSDVITRIVYARKPEGLEKLHAAVSETINQMIQEFIAEHKIDLNDIVCVLCAGNTTMIHLLLRIDPAYIRREPYLPTANFLPVLRAFEAGIKINPRGFLATVPGVSSYVGGDVTAGVLSTGLYKEEELSILIDIGTNGEVVLGNKDFLVAAAASAGPAFEGSGVSCGMRSTKGAIQKVKIASVGMDVSYETIAGAPARGICGSGYIELIFEMLKVRILDKDGKIKPLENKRIRQGQQGREFAITPEIFISEADIENLKRAKAAIYSSIFSLFKHTDINLSAVKKIFIAGGFGTSIDIDKAIGIGLLPDAPRERFIFSGNSSLAGARQMLLSQEAIELADEIAKKITYLELSVEPGYMDEYMGALFFPHTDLKRFPSWDM